VIRFPARLALAIVAVVCLQAQTAGMEQFAIQDPVLKMRAWSLTAPANWDVAGTMMPPSSCAAGTSPTYRATSRDGSAGMYMDPRADWAWGAGARAGSDCLPFQSALSAKQYLGYTTRLAKVGVIRVDPIPLAPSPYATFDEARATVLYSVGGKPVEGFFDATVTCQQTNMIGIGVAHVCSGFIKRAFAPEAKFAALRPTFDAMRMTLNQAWMQQWTLSMQQASDRRSRAQTEAMLYQGRLAGQARMAEHASYMSAMQQQADVRTGAFEASQYRKQNNSDNEVDYILDCQRSYSGNVRVSSSNCPNRQTF
jgi:hypothetical protein